MTKKRKKLRATVEKIIKPKHPSQPEKVQIAIPDGEPLYQEIRIENELIDDAGEKSNLKVGAEVDVIVEADSSATMKKPEKT